MINSIEDDIDFGDLDICPLYRVNENTSSNDPLSKCNLLHLFTNLMKDTKGSNNAIKTAAWLFMTANSVARGAEIEFQVLKEWDNDHCIKVTNTCWTELKTCNFYAMARVPDEKWCFCFYFHMSAYFMCCNCLYRNEDQIQKNLSMAMFPSLHSIQGAAIAKRITAAIRKYLPALFSKENKDKFSSRSLCQGAITKLSTHSAINFFQACSQLGHSTGTSLDLYINKRNVAKTLPAANALHRWHSIYSKVVFLQLESLGAEILSQIESLMAAFVHCLQSRVQARQ
jgi:hypothetical protein